jgi:hypothetical protein
MRESKAPRQLALSGTSKSLFGISESNHCQDPLAMRAQQVLSRVWLLPVICAFICAFVATTGCNLGIPGNGVAGTEKRELDAFEKISLSGIGTATITVGQTQSVSVTVDENLLQYVVTEVKDGELRIDTTESISPKVPLAVTISVPSLAAAKVAGVGDIGISNASGESLTLGISGAGSLEAKGSVKSLEVNVSGVGDAKLGELQAESVTVSVSGTGSAEVHASKSVDAKVSGVGDIVILGNPPEVHKSTSGVGNIVVRE